MHHHGTLSTYTLVLTAFLDGVETRPPHSAYPLSALPAGTEHYGSDPEGTIGVHHPKEIVRIERDWSGGDVCQFYTSWVMELEGRVGQHSIL
jgi:hypothetical protein